MEKKNIITECTEGDIGCVANLIPSESTKKNMLILPLIKKRKKESSENVELKNDCTGGLHPFIGCVANMDPSESMNEIAIINSRVGIEILKTTGNLLVLVKLEHLCYWAILLIKFIDQLRLGGKTSRNWVCLKMKFILLLKTHIKEDITLMV